MLEFELLGSNGTIHTYAYFPNGDRTHHGSIQYDAEKRTFDLLKLADNDQFERFALHLISRLRTADTDDLPIRGMVAWH